MADKTLKVTLSAKDDASAAFKKLGDSAKTLGESLQQTGKSSSSFKQNLEDSARAAEENGKQFARADKIIKDTGRDIGISIGIISAGMVLASQSFRDNEIALQTLDRSYGDASDSMRDFTQQIQDTTNFSNDQALAAANVAGTLARNYAFTADEIQQVLTISADLAAANGVSLEDAASRVVAALRGEAEGAEALGLTMNQAAIDSQNLTLTMSNQEAGHYRLNALYEQAAFAQGAAAQQADSFYGKMTQLKDSVQDAAQSFGGLIGPIGQFGAFAADNAITVAALGVGLVQLGQGVPAAIRLAQTINQVTVAMTGLTVASQGLAALKGLALILAGPVGLAAGFAAVAIAMEKLGEKGSGKTAEEVWSDTAAGAEHLQTVLAALASTGATDLYSLGSSGSDVLSGMYTDFQRIQELIEAIDHSADNNTAPETLLRWKGELQDLLSTYGGVYSATQDFSDAQNDLAMIMADTGVGAGQAQIELAELIGQFKSGEINATMFVEDLGQIADNLGSYDVAATKAAAGTKALTDEQKAYNLELAKANQTLEDYKANQQIGGQNLAGEHREEAKALDDLAKSRDASNQAFQEYLDMDAQRAGQSAAALSDTQAAAAAQAVLQVGITAAADAMTYQVGESQRLAAEMEKQAAAVAELQTQYADTFATMQSTATQATDTLDSVFRSIVGNTDAIASQSQAVADWADKLIGAAGTYAEIDDLLQNNAITLDEYTAAQESYNQIADANVRIQEDVLSIQAQLAPIVATATEALAAQMDQLASGSTDAQLFALGMMDAATSSQALALAQGYLSNQEVFGPMIQSAAELNPMLAQILEEMGLISYNPATGTVELLGVDESQSELANLTDAMTQLDGTLATLNAILQDDASGPIGDVDSAINGLDGNTATVYANVQDNASGILAGVSSMLASLDGASATSYITTVRQEVNQVLSPYRAHGGVASYATGGVVAELAEWGPELAHFATGGTMPIMDRGLYEVPMNTYISPNNTGTAVGGQGVTINISVGDVNGYDDFATRLVSDISKGLQRANSMYERGMGW